MNNSAVSTSMCTECKPSTKRVMLDLLIALAPAAIASIVLFGFKAAVMIAVCMVTAMLSEYFFNKICKRDQTVGDLSAAVTGLLLALNLSTNVTIWQCLVGSFFAIIIVKCAFGGLGYNFANPAITARVMLLIAFSEVAGGAMTVFAELESGATPLAILGGVNGTPPTMLDMLIGNRGGAIGETCAIALILGGIYLLIRKVISWHIPVVYIGTVFLFSFALSGDVITAVYHVLGGGLLIAAFFMITDYVTTPINPAGKIVFALGCGVITVLIRFWSNYPEGVSFAILIMNILSPYIEKLCTKKPFGKVDK